MLGLAVIHTQETASYTMVLKHKSQRTVVNGKGSELRLLHLGSFRSCNVTSGFQKTQFISVLHPSESVIAKIILER